MLDGILLTSSRSFGTTLLIGRPWITKPSECNILAFEDDRLMVMMG